MKTLVHLLEDAVADNYHDDLGHAIDILSTLAPIRPRGSLSTICRPIPLMARATTIVNGKPHTHSCPSRTE
jgi:hypothetical protein